MRDTALIYETCHGLNDNIDNKCHGNENVPSFGPNIGFDTDLERSSIHVYYYNYCYHPYFVLGI